MNVEEIHRTLIYGQREQAVEQIDEYGDYFWLEYSSYLREHYFPYAEHAAFEALADAIVSYFRIKTVDTPPPHSIIT